MTTVPVMFLAAGGVPSLWLVAATVVGGTMAAGSANTLNCVIDRDIDEQMLRTRRRPLPRHQVSPRGATVFGLVLGAAATLLLGLTVNWLSAGLALAANVFYVVGYSLLLKRRTTQNIVWGGAAGCFPALIGWTAVTGELPGRPLSPSWSCSSGRRRTSGRWRCAIATTTPRPSVPMLPSVAPAAVVGRQIVTYTWATVAVSLLLWPVASTGWVYPTFAAGLGVVFLGEAYALWHRARTTEDPVALKPMRLFHFSNAYLALLFLAIALDPLLTR